MRQVSNPIREGAEGFLKIQYSAISRMAVLMALIIMGSYSLRPSGSMDGGVDQLGPVMLGFLSSSSFAIGAACSAFTGEILFAQELALVALQAIQYIVHVAYLLTNTCVIVCRRLH